MKMKFTAAQVSVMGRIPIVSKSLDIVFSADTGGVLAEARNIYAPPPLIFYVESISISEADDAISALY